MEAQHHEDTSKLKAWLDRLQQESWQLELLISGFAIFGILNLKDFIYDLEFKIDNFVFGGLSAILSILIFVLSKGWLIFFINLTVHVVLRGLWIGAIGLRYVSEGIDFEQLGYADRFDKYLQKKIGTYDLYIEKLERICSVIFSYTFLLFFLFLSGVMFVLGFLAIFFILEKIGVGKVNDEANSMRGLIGAIYLLIGLIVFIDFVSLGLFKKIRDKHISAIYMIIYKFYSTITLSFIYRPLLYNFIDNRYTRRWFYMGIPYIFIVVMGPVLFVNNPHPFYPDQGQSMEAGVFYSKEYYEDELKNFNMHKSIPPVILEKFRVGNAVSVFFVNDERLNNLLEKENKLKPYRKKDLNFSFSSGIKDMNDDELDIANKKSAELVDLINQRKEINKKIRSSGVSSLYQEKIDSINNLIATKEKFWNEQLNKQKNERVMKHLSVYLDGYQVYLDSVRIDLSDCLFDNTVGNVKGVRCFINLDTIPVGLHRMSVTKKIISKTEKLDFINVNLPFLKI